MAGFLGIAKDTMKLGASKVAQGAKYIANGAGKVTGKFYDSVSRFGAGLETRALNSGTTSNIGRILRTNADEAINNIANKAANKAASSVAEGAGEQVGKELTKKVSSGIGKNALIGGAVGSITGAGIGGITGMATGADDDNMKSMVVMGALAGGAGGAMIGAGSKMFRNRKITGSMFSQTTDDALKAAEQMATKGGENAAVNGGAKGFFNKAGAKVQSFGDKIDNIGDNVSSKIMANKTAQMDAPVRNKIFKEFQDIGFDMADAQDYAQGLYGDMKLADAVKPFQKRANMIGGAAQGAIMGSVGGAVIGGVGGAIDEDESFIGGAIKGGFVGGTLGGLAGGASGYFNNNAKVLSNTTSNINSLLGKK